MIFKHRKFTPFFWTQFEGALNDNFFKNALVVLITYKSIQLFGLGTQAVVALASGIFILPFFLFSSFAGQICDKYDKQKLIRIIKWAEVGIMGLAGLGFMLNDFRLLMFVLFLMGTQSAFFSPIKYSIIPNLSGSKLLVKANAYLEMGTFVAILVGTILGVWASSVSISYVIFGLMVFALVGVLFGYFCVPLPISDSELKLNFNLVTSNYQILKLPTYRKDIFYSIMGISWFWFFGAGLLALLPIFVKETLNGEEYVLMAFLSLFTIGIALGSFAYDRITHGLIDVGVIPIAALFMTVFLLVLSMFDYSTIGYQADALLTLRQFVDAPGSYFVMFSFFMVAFFGGIYIVPLFALIQDRGDKTFISRIIASNNIYNALFMVLSSILIMVLSYFNFSAVEIFVVFALLNLLVSIYIYFKVPEFTLRFLGWMLTKVMYRTSVVGLENIPKNGSALLACNHISWVDWLIIIALVPRPPRFVMHNDFMHIPIIRHIFKHGKVIPIAGHYENKAVMQKAIDQIYSELKNNQIVCLFPEGGISKDGDLQRFKKGIEVFSRTSGIDVVPMSLNGMWGSVFSRKATSYELLIRLFTRPKVELCISKPIASDLVNATLIKEAVSKTYKA